MIAMDVQMDDTSTKFLLKQARLFPNEVRRAFYYACGVMLRNMRSMMSGKSKRIEKWQDFTRKLRNFQGITFGGKLMESSSTLSMNPEGDRVRLGWIGSWVEPYATRFQNESSVETSKSWRHWLYCKGWFVHGEVPKVANTPARPVIAEALKDGEKHLADWTLGAFDKVLSKRIPKWLDYAKNNATESGLKAARRAVNAYKAIHRGGDPQEIMARGATRVA